MPTADYHRRLQLAVTKTMVLFSLTMLDFRSARGRDVAHVVDWRSSASD